MTEQQFTELPQTGDDAVDRALQPFADLTGTLAEQVETYIGAHRALTERLTELDS